VFISSLETTYSERVRLNMATAVNFTVVLRSCGRSNTLRTMRMTSSKCVLQQRHLLGYESEPETLTLTLTLTLELTLTLTLFLTLTGTKFLKENKNDTGI